MPSLRFVLTVVVLVSFALSLPTLAQRPARPSGPALSQKATPPAPQPPIPRNGKPRPQLPPVQLAPKEPPPLATVHSFDEVWNSSTAQEEELWPERSARSRARPKELYRNASFAELASQVYVRITAPFTSASNRTALIQPVPPPAPVSRHPEWNGTPGPRISMPTFNRTAQANGQAAVSRFLEERDALASDRTVPAGLLQSVWLAHLGEIGREYRGLIRPPYPESTRAEIRDLGVLFRNTQEVIRDPAVGYELLKADVASPDTVKRNAAITAAAVRITSEPALRERLLRGTSQALEAAPKTPIPQP